MKYFLYSLFLTILFSPAFTYAELPCGNIIVPEELYSQDSPLVTIPVADCSDPFNKTQGVESPYILKIGGAEVHEGEIVEVPVGGTRDYVVEGYPILSLVTHSYYLHDGNDYRYVNTTLIEPGESDYRRFASEFFGEDVNYELYIQVMLGSRDFFGLDDDQRQVFSEYSEYINTHFVYETPILAPGEYTLVSKESLLILSNENYFHKIMSVFIPTAYAQTFQENIFTLTFEIVEVPEVSECCSSVVFLPGIKGSILKKVGFLGTEDTLWPPTSYSDDVAQLALNQDGVSVEDIFVDGVLSTFYGTSIYEGFESYIETLVADNTIANWEPLPYDWRFSPEQILNDGVKTKDGIVDLIKQIEDVAEDSNTGQVTIVAHSMGGLMGKAIIKKLEEEGKADLVDSFIMVGSPQLGTPQAITSMLHGEGESILAGRIVDAGTSRYVAQNMQSSYNLLPSVRYFEEVSDPVIIFNQNDWYTESWVREWGQNINTYSKYSEFITGQKISRVEPQIGSLSLPEIVRKDLVDNANIFHDEYDDYTPPSHIRVVQIAGWGLPTIKSVLYRSRHLILPTYEPDFTAEGDGTVVFPSAISSHGEKYFFNLDLYQKENVRSDHKDLLSTNPVQDVITKIIKEELIDNIDFVSNSKPNPSGIETQLLVSAHSPVLLGVYDSSGNYTGVNSNSNEGLIISQEIPKSSYKEFGDSQYIFLPKEGEYIFKYKGTNVGSTTLELESFTNNVKTPIVTFTDIPTTPNTYGTFTIISAVPENTQIELDLDGNGIVDKIVKNDGYKPTLKDLIADLKNTISNLSVQSQLKKSLLSKVLVFEQVLNIKNLKLRSIALSLNINIIKLEVELLRKNNKVSLQEATNILQLLTKIKGTI